MTEEKETEHSLTAAQQKLALAEGKLELLNDFYASDEDEVVDEKLARATRRLVEAEVKLRAAREREQRLLRLLFSPFYATPTSEGRCRVCEHFVSGIDRMNDKSFHAKDCPVMAE
jgi:hypothetical protein